VIKTIQLIFSSLAFLHSLYNLSSATPLRYMLLLAGTEMPQQSKQPTTGAMSQSTTRLLTCFHCHNTVNCRVNIPPGNPKNQNQPHLEKSETTLKAKVNHVSAINSCNQKRSVLGTILPPYKLALDIPEIRIPPPDFYEE